MINGDDGSTRDLLTSSCALYIGLVWRLVSAKCIYNRPVCGLHWLHNYNVYHIECIPIARMRTGYEQLVEPEVQVLEAMT